MPGSSNFRNNAICINDMDAFWISIAIYVYQDVCIKTVNYQLHLPNGWRERLRTLHGIPNCARQNHIYYKSWSCIYHALTLILNPESPQCQCIGVQLFFFKNYHTLPGRRKCRLLLCFSSFMLFLSYVWMKIVEDTIRK